MIQGIDVDQAKVLLRAIEAKRCQQSMHYMIKHVVWPVLEPNTEFIDNWHLHAVCEHAEAVVKGDIKNLLVNLPPRFMKSLTMSVGLHVWGWINDPGLRYIYASYGADISLRDAEKARTVIRSPIFQALFGGLFELKKSEDAKNRYSNDRQGQRVSTSVSGMGTGEGGDILVADDPHNVREGESEDVRQAVLSWWDETMSSRLNNPKTGRKVIVMQRVHEKDLSGHVLAKGGYEHLLVPMRFEPARRKASILGNYDPRTEPNELAWPTRFDEEATKRLERDMGSYAAAGQLQQRPAPRGGGLTRVEWFKRYEGLPTDYDQRVVSWDTAASTQLDSAYSVGTVWRFTDERVWLEAVIRARAKYPDLRKLVKTTSKTFRADFTLIEDASTGQALIPDLTDSTDRELMVDGVVPIKADKSKEERLMRVLSLIESGRVFLPHQAAWLDDYVKEFESFPNGATKDQVDSTTQFLWWWRQKYYTGDADSVSVFMEVGNASGVPQFYAHSARR